ncbi:MAG: recombinase family protein [Clostridiaceae bacterium]|nr:recombinase family protein [Clostridiaceae bacterium]
MYAIYARQSIEKSDSISIETQINLCSSFAKGEFLVYKDAGYSGSSTDRPDFQRLLSDIEAGKISAVICYRLDRISRSLTDFAKLIEFFEKYKVQFISATEQFDTSSPIGRAMVYIIMVFAQLERETIVERIKDNYFSRAKKGMFLGGRCPFGYKSKQIILDGKKCSVLEIDPDEASILKEIFRRYTEENESLYNIAISLPGSWTSNKVSRILKNPAPVKNSIDLYEYFKNNGYQIANQIDDFNGENGCLLVGKEKGKKNRVYCPTSEQTLVIGLHSPIIDARTYIAAQARLQKNKASKRLGTGHLSWLTGLLRCGLCGYSVTSKVVKGYKYFCCRGRSNYGPDKCSVKKLFVAGEIEKAVEAELLKRCRDTKLLLAPSTDTPHDMAIKAQIIKIDEQIDNLLSQMAEGVVGEYIAKKIESLDAKKKELQAQIKTKEPAIDPEKIEEMRNIVLNEWQDLDIKLKHSIAEFFINKIYISEDEMRIEWAF